MDSNIDELWQIFKMKFLSVANTHAPYRSFRAKGRSVPWISHDIVSLIKERDNNNDILEFDSKLLKLSAHVIYTYLTCLFNLSLQQKLVPVDWKTA